MRRWAFGTRGHGHALVEFLVARRGPQAVRELVRLLVARAVTPDEAFTRGSGLSSGELEPQWKAFVAVP